RGHRLAMPTDGATGATEGAQPHVAERAADLERMVEAAQAQRRAPRAAVVGTANDPARPALRIESHAARRRDRRYGDLASDQRRCPCSPAPSRFRSARAPPGPERRPG